MNQSFISLQFEKIEKRLNEVDTLLTLASINQTDENVYQALCRSAHVLLVSHFEGLYKDICKDIIDDINSNTSFYEVKKDIFYTHCSFFIQNTESNKSVQSIRIRLYEAFSNYQANLRIEPFLFLDNKNPAPKILESLLEKFGVNDFFWQIADSELDTVFEDQKSKSSKIRSRLFRYIRKNIKFLSLYSKQ